MPTVRRKLDLPYRSDDLFELVSDIKRYPEFIKWIKALRVLSPEQNGFVHTCIGEAVIGFKGFTERFATHVRSNQATTTVDVALARGPFRKLQNTWTISPSSHGSELHFYLDYDFSNPVLKALAVSNSAIAIDKIMTAFLAEAEKRYTPVSAT